MVSSTTSSEDGEVCRSVTVTSTRDSPSLAGMDAVIPATSNGSHGWSARWLQHWMFSRLDRPRFKRCVDLGRESAPFALYADEVFACDASDLRSIPSDVDLAYVDALST